MALRSKLGMGTLSASMVALFVLMGGGIGCGDGGGTGGSGGTGGMGGGAPSYCGFTGDKLAICGVVQDSAGSPLNGAVVHLDSVTATTAADGSFKIASTVGGAHPLTIEKPGFSPLATIVTSSVADRNFSLTPIAETTISSLGASLVITDPFSGATATLAPSDLVDDKGNGVTAPIMVGIHYLNPAIEPLPGDYGAIDAQNSPTLLDSFGAVYIEARYPDGTMLKLKNGAKVDVAIPIPKDRVAFSPKLLPVWIFDQAAGVWRQQSGMLMFGGAVAPGCNEFKSCNSGNCPLISTIAFTGSAPSLGFVNADVPHMGDPACLRIEIDRPGLSPSDLPVCLRIVGPVGSPVTQAHQGCFNAGTSAYYNLPANVDVTIERIVDVGCVPTPGGTTVTVNTGSPWGGTGMPSDPSLCNGVLSIPPLP